MNLVNVEGNEHRLDMTAQEALRLASRLTAAAAQAFRGRSDGLVSNGVVVERGHGVQQPGSLTLLVVREGA